MSKQTQQQKGLNVCTKDQDLHKNKVSKKKEIKEDKPNEAELFFLLNEDILN